MTDASMVATSRGMSPEESFARMVLERGFRFAEIAAVEQQPVADVLRRLTEPEVQAHLQRLHSRGYGATKVAGAREIKEVLTQALVLDWDRDYAARCTVTAAGVANTNPKDFWLMKIAAAKALTDVMKMQPKKPIGKRLGSKSKILQAIRSEIIDVEAREAP